MTGCHSQLVSLLAHSSGRDTLQPARRIACLIFRKQPQSPHTGTEGSGLSLGQAVNRCHDLDRLYASVWRHFGNYAKAALILNQTQALRVTPHINSLALVFARATPAMRTVWIALLAVSLGTAACVVSVGRGALAWNDRSAQSQWLEWLSPVVNLPRGYPSFFWSLDPSALSSEIPFLVHAAIWTVGIALTVWIFVRLSSSPHRTAAGRAVLVVWCGAAAWMALVHAGCAVTRRAAQESGGGLWFAGFGEFAAALDLLLPDTGLRRRLGSRGREYVLRTCRWDDVARRTIAALG